MRSDAAAHAVHFVHTLLSGSLFTWAIVGPDPAPHRPTVTFRLVVLGVAVAVHAGLSQLLYAGLWVQVTATTAERRGAAEWMYYGGDVFDLALALVLVVGAARRRPTPARGDEFRGPPRSTPQDVDGGTVDV